jgi:hypothetical protein
MTIKEMHQQNEWEIIQLLNIGTKKIFFLIFLAGGTLMISSFVGKELITERIAQAAENFRQKEFKQNSSQKLFNQWFALKNSFCHFNYLDLKKNNGSNFSLIKFYDNFTIQKVISAEKFSIDQEKKEIIIENGSSISIKKKEQKNILNQKISLPSFFTQLPMKATIPTLKNLFHVIIFDNNRLPTHVYKQLFNLFFSRILSYLLLLIYPLLTFMLFMLFPYHKYYRWFLIFLPYPLVTLLLTVSHAAFSPYAILLALITGLYFAIRK